MCMCRSTSISRREPSLARIARSPRPSWRRDDERRRTRPRARRRRATSENRRAQHRATAAQRARAGRLGDRAARAATRASATSPGSNPSPYSPSDRSSSYTGRREATGITPPPARAPACPGSCARPRRRARARQRRPAPAPRSTRSGRRTRRARAAPDRASRTPVSGRATTPWRATPDPRAATAAPAGRSAAPHAPRRRSAGARRRSPPAIRHRVRCADVGAGQDHPVVGREEPLHQVAGRVVAGGAGVQAAEEQPRQRARQLCRQHPLGRRVEAADVQRARVAQRDA